MQIFTSHGGWPFIAIANPCMAVLTWLLAAVTEWIGLVKAVEKVKAKEQREIERKGAHGRQACKRRFCSLPPSPLPSTAEEKEMWGGGRIGLREGVL